MNVMDKHADKASDIPLKLLKFETENQLHELFCWQY